MLSAVKKRARRLLPFQTSHVHWKQHFLDLYLEHNPKPFQTSVFRDDKFVAVLPGSSDVASERSMGVKSTFTYTVETRGAQALFDNLRCWQPSSARIFVGICSHRRELLVVDAHVKTLAAKDLVDRAACANYVVTWLESQPK